ncbi:MULTISPECIES: MarR family transcriptional regulator [unclassified Mesorhizobium]|uniref:MarR family winged helix-turn-helix transcriptional regulator n=1 Tax=unclassified Mesorhizobium TaxID=325217 RepID=UPI0033384E6D
MDNQPYTQSLLLYAYQSSASALVQVLRESGHAAIKPKHGAVFANIDAEGTRPSVLAQRAGIGKASMGELIDELERLGYVRRSHDPNDRRAKLIVATDAALAVIRTVHDFNQRLEDQYRRLLGAQAYESLRSSLQAISPSENLQPRIPRQRS